MSSDEENVKNIIVPETAPPRWYMLPTESPSPLAIDTAAADGNGYEMRQPELKTPTSSRGRRRILKACRSLPRLGKNIFFADSGSDDDDDVDTSDEDTNFVEEKFLRNKVSLCQEKIKIEEHSVKEGDERERQEKIEIEEHSVKEGDERERQEKIEIEEHSVKEGDERERQEKIEIEEHSVKEGDERERQEKIEIEEHGVKDGDKREELGDEFAVEDVVQSEPSVLENVKDDMNVCMSGPEQVCKVFQWTDDFTTFTGQKELYQRDPGPTFKSQDPVDIFLKFWDVDIMGLIATETNKYARQNIEQFMDPELKATLPKYLEQWEDVTIPALYQYFALMICMSFCVRSKFQDYWVEGIMEMPIFRQVMSRDAFLLITKFLHFVSDRETATRGYARKIGKVAPILDHCNQKFSELYIPSQHISLDESILLWKGSLSWRQSTRSKAACFIGIKSFELCEATTGYLLKCKLYTGIEAPMHSKPLHGFPNKTAKDVLDLMEGYMDAGHVLVMDNWYNHLLLTRYLKSRATDVLGIISRTRKDIPQDIKDLKQNRVARGDWHARHCGDIALVTWQDVELVTVASTYHDHQIVPGGPAGVAKELPVAVKDYNKYKGGVDLKDQKLSTFLFERKRCHKWYMKVFRRLVNTSLLNAFIIYTKNPLHRLCSHRDFRRKVAEGLLARFGKARIPLPASVSDKSLRLQPGKHFPVYTANLPNKAEHKKISCVRCKILHKRTQVRLMCSLCQVPLCIGKCWMDYHSLENLSTAPDCR